MTHFVMASKQALAKLFYLRTGYGYNYQQKSAEAHSVTQL